MGRYNAGFSMGRRRRRLAIGLVALGAAVVAGLAAWVLRGPRATVRRDPGLSVLLIAGSWPMWRGGFNPPGRFLVPIVPLLLVAVALV